MNNLALDYTKFVENTIPESSRFIIDSDSKAEWALKKIANCKSSIAEKEAFRDQQIQQANNWFDSATIEDSADIQHFETLLAVYAEQKLDGAKRRSIKLPSGTIGFRKGAVKFLIAGQVVSAADENLIAWTKENDPDLLKIKESVDWAELKKKLTIAENGKVLVDGEIIADMQAEQAPDTFYAKVIGDE